MRRSSRSRTINDHSSNRRSSGHHGPLVDDGLSSSTHSLSSHSQGQSALSLGIGMSHSQAAKLVEEMMMKQMEISQKTLAKMQTLGSSIDDVAEAEAFATQQEAISHTFASMVHSMIDRLSKQELEIDDLTRVKEHQERNMQRNEESLEFKISQIKTLEQKLDALERQVHSAPPSSSSKSSHSRKSAGPADCKKLKSKLKQKSSELRRVKSKLSDSQFLLQAYKERCEIMEDKTAAKKSLFKFRGNKRDDTHLGSQNSSLVQALQQNDKTPKRTCDASVDMSLYCL